MQHPPAATHQPWGTINRVSTLREMTCTGTAETMVGAVARQSSPSVRTTTGSAEICTRTLAAEVTIIATANKLHDGVPADCLQIISSWKTT